MEPTTHFVIKPAGKIIVLDQDAALAAAITHQEPTDNTIAVYSDGSRLENGDRGYAAVTQVDIRLNKWRNASAFVEENKEAYDAELFGIAAGLELALSNATLQNNPTGCVRLFTDAQAALKRLQHDTPGPGQWLLPRISCAEASLRAQGWRVEYRWVLGHKDVLGNELAPACQGSSDKPQQALS